MRTIRWRRVLPAGFALALMFGPVACGDETVDAVEEAVGAEDVDAGTVALADSLRANDMETLASAVETINIGEVAGDGGFTLFGPDDEAFLALGGDELADLLAAPDELVEVLQAHLVAERLDADTLSGMDSVQTRAGTTLNVSVDGDTIMVGDATVIAGDIDAGDGIVHLVDTVIMP